MAILHGREVNISVSMTTRKGALMSLCKTIGDGGAVFSESTGVMAEVPAVTRVVRAILQLKCVMCGGEGRC